MAEVECVDVPVWQTVVAESGDVLLTFYSRAMLPDPVEIRVDGNDLVLRREPGPSLRLLGFHRDDLRVLRDAPAIVVSHGHVEGSDQDVDGILVE